MKKKRRTYEPRVFDGRIIIPDEIERIHKEVLEFERIGSVGDSATLVRDRRLGVRRVSRILLDAADEIERSVKRPTLNTE
jgi:hypothetical protein